MNFVVFIPSGIGDALLLVSLIKELKKKGNVTGIFDHAPANHQLFKITNLINNTILINYKYDHLLIAAKYYSKFDAAYLNFICSSRKNLLLALFISKEVFTNKIPENLAGIIRKKLKYIQPLKGIHDSVQNLRLLNGFKDNYQISEDMIHVKYDTVDVKLDTHVDLSNTLIAVQISSGNNIQKYKNWEVENWIEFLSMASVKYNHCKFVLIGHTEEIELANSILNKKMKNVVSVVGKTNIHQAIKLIQSCSLFIGLDGGLMHIAVSLQKPTFTLWGQSDPLLYGYEKMNPLKNKIIRDPNVQSHSWIEPIAGFNYLDNSSLKKIKPQYVFEQFCLFVSGFING